MQNPNNSVTTEQTHLQNLSDNVITNQKDKQRLYEH
jgi:hypothetical protein